MQFVPLEIPPGVFRNGTEYQSQGRWYDASLVRWENGEMKPVGGWQQKGSSLVTGSARGLLAWRGNQAGIYVAIGCTGDIESDTAQAGAPSTITLATGASTTDDFYNNQIIKIVSGTGSGQYRRVTDYVGSTRVATVDEPWDTNPDSTSVYQFSGTGLYAVKSDNTMQDITPSGIRQQPTDASNAGYGWLSYGSGTYGTGRSVSGQYTFAKTWSLDTWGQYLIACLDGDGRIYEWQLDSTADAAVIANAPTECVGVVTTEERFVFALGADGDDRKVAWCDQGDNTVWAAANSNQAGSRILESNGPIMQGVRARGQTLILTTTDVYAATYIGAPLIYNFERVGSSNGIVSRQAAAASDSFVAWMGPRGFWIYDGYVREIPCQVEDYVFSDIDQDQISLVHAWVNSQYNEIWWHYPSEGATECDRYVTWNYAENHWSIGAIDQPASIDRGVFRYPLAVDSTGALYEREVVGLAHGSEVPFATSGPIEIGRGRNVYVTKMIADEKTQGDVSATLLTRQFPNGPQRSFGPYSMRDPVSLRIGARQVGLKIEESEVGDWRWGTPRVAIRPGGVR